MVPNLIWLVSLKEEEISTQALTVGWCCEDKKMVIYKPKTEVLDEINPADTLFGGSQPLELKKINICCLSHPVCDMFLQQPQQTINFYCS